MGGRGDAGGRNRFPGRDKVGGGAYRGRWGWEGGVPSLATYGVGGCGGGGREEEVVSLGG